MGASMSASTRSLISSVDGNGVCLKERFGTPKHQDLIGEGNFGRVYLLKDRQGKEIACKSIRKGMELKDNILYPPLERRFLRGEIEILRLLKGRSFCLQLQAVYESTWKIYVLTEVCHGGAMSEWVKHHQEDVPLRLEDVIRITKQLFTAVNHCHEQKILHRDIKPDNVMFVRKERHSDLRLIDFGSGCIEESSSGVDCVFRTTYVGTAFFLAPEVFQKKYNCLADVWSAAVTIYVLVASYPHDNLQRAFNMLQSSNRDVRKLPGNDSASVSMPDQYYHFLESSLQYSAENRPRAKDILKHPFLQAEKKAPVASTHLKEDGRHQIDSVANQQMDEYSLAAMVNSILAGCTRQYSPTKEPSQPTTNFTCHLALLDHLL